MSERGSSAEETGGSGEIFLSVVIPVFNEGGNIGPLHLRLAGVLEGMGRPFEIIYVDDGSTDRTWDIIKGLGGDDRRVRGVRFRRNFGQTAALSAGFNRARGEVVVSMDGDGQNSPEDIPRLLEKMSGESEGGPGYDLVNGWRRVRKDGLFHRRIPSWIANRIISVFTGLDIHDFGCTLRAYRSEILKDINLYGEMHRMMPVLAHMTGARIAEIEVSHQPRRHGASKYTLGRVLSVILDLITLKFFIGYFTRPLHFFGLLGAGSLFLGLSSFAVVVLMKAMSGIDMTGNPFLILGVFLFIIGGQLIMLGLLGEVNVRTYYEAQNKHTYTVRESF